MNKKIIITLAIIIILLGALTIAESYKESKYKNLKDFFLNKLSPEQKTDFEEFNELNLKDKSLKDFFLNKLSPEQKTDFEEFSQLNIFDKIQTIKEQKQPIGDADGE